MTMCPRVDAHTALHTVRSSKFFSDLIFSLLLGVISEFDLFSMDFNQKKNVVYPTVCIVII